MSVLSDRRCSTTFGVPVLSIEGEELHCTDRHGRQLVNDVQVGRNTVLEPATEKLVLARVTTRSYCPMGVMESVGSHIPVATSLSVPQKQRRIWIRCMNHGSQPITLHPGETVGRYSAAESVQVLDSEEVNPAQVKVLNNAQISEDTPLDSEVVLAHLLLLYQQRKTKCEDTTQLQQFLSLLTRYSDVFSSGEKDVGHTTLIEHSIPTIRDAKPVGLLPQKKRRRPKSRFKTY